MNGSIDFYLWRGMMPEGEINTDKDRLFAIWYISHFIGKWYKWGGDDPSGFDCSGTACEYLKAAGKIKRKSDYTAHQLYEMFPKVSREEVKPGCLVFWWNEDNSKIIHVEIVIETKRMLSLGASGGGSKTVTEADAIRNNAFIKVRPILSRGGNFVFADPFKEGD